MAKNRKAKRTSQTRGKRSARSHAATPHKEHPAAPRDVSVSASPEPELVDILRGAPVPELDELVAESRASVGPDEDVNVDSSAVLANPSLFPVAIDVPERRRNPSPLGNAVFLGLLVGLAVGTVWIARSVQSRFALESASLGTIEQTSGAHAARPNATPSSTRSVQIPEAALPAPGIAAFSPSAPLRLPISIASPSAREPAVVPRAARPQPVLAQEVRRADGPALVETSQQTACRAACNGSLQCMLACFPVRPALAGQGTSASALRIAPRAADVRLALAAVSGQARACAGGASGFTALTLTFASNGRLTTAGVGLPYAGTPTGSCIARAVRTAQVPPFAQGAARFVLPFQMH